VYNIERTSDAVTQADGVWISFAIVVALYLVLGVGTVLALRAMSRRWRRQDVTDEAAPYGPRSAPEPETAGEERA
jgi:cytochrome d ubiquinol oxidase subunit I